MTRTESGRASAIRVRPASFARVMARLVGAEMVASNGTPASAAFSTSS